MAGKKKGLELNLQDRRQSLPLLAVVLVLLAAWFGWGGWSLLSSERHEQQALAAREEAVAAMQQVLATQGSQLAQRVAKPEVGAALAAGDTAAAAQAVRAGWQDVKDVQVLEAALEAGYADAGTFGYAKLALLERALEQGQPQAGIVLERKQPVLGVAAATGGHVVYAVLPATAVTAAVSNAALPEGAYLALRQGSHTVAESGDASLSASADSGGRSVGTSGLRVVEATPAISEGPMGLGAVQCLIVAGLLLLVAALSVLLAFQRLRVPTLALARKREPGAVAHGSDVTFGEAIKREAPPVPARTETSEAPAKKAVGSAAGGHVDPGIFRAYDIRGVVGGSLTVRTAELIGQAIGSVMSEAGFNNVVVGRDGRLSGPELSAGLIEGLRRAGIDVIDIGLAPTPVCYFAAYHLQTGSCVAVTGSHNPPDYNGFKIVIGGETLSGEAITALYTRITEGQLISTDKGSLEARDVAQDYLERIAGDVQLARPLKVVIDAGNGVAGEFAPALMEAIGAEAIPLYCDVDGTFPNHHPDPSEPHNLQDLIQTVQRFNADIGLAFDGDGDRLGVVTREGEIIYADRLLMLFAGDVLERNPGAMVIYDVKCTGKLQGWVLRHGGTPMMWRTGHSLIKGRMRETGAELAGEMSGHFFFQERWYGFDDGLYAAARLLEILAASEEAPSDTLAALPNGVSTPELKVAVGEASPHEIVERFVEVTQFEGARLSTIDGLRADWDDGWGLLRASNTTPVLVLRFEADDQAALDRIRDAFRGTLQQVAPELTLTF
ncbi:phosphomannomutase/phosphoglucomutase [Pseudoxanthomonas composti]|uniref:phosphomannomutase n=1 Tax=Pseudoxanthomonas composti TaxID=2137479 RepID=A0A4Q1JRB8_9GAMM|nr:phosphomannomutase/phosphoglucomutase [Pseudoxanthomonas composti]